MASFLGILHFRVGCHCSVRSPFVVSIDDGVVWYVLVCLDSVKSRDLAVLWTMSAFACLRTAIKDANLYLANYGTASNLHLGLDDGAVSNALCLDHRAAFDDNPISYVHIARATDNSSLTNYRASSNENVSILSRHSCHWVQDRVLI